MSAIETSHDTYYRPGQPLLEPSIFKCVALHYLTIERTKITTIQPLIRQLVNLEWLTLSRNDITFLPKEIGDLKNLRTLNVSYNHIWSLPPSFGKLKSLQNLDIQGNPIRFLEAALGNLTSLSSFKADKGLLQLYDCKNECSLPLRLIREKALLGRFICLKLMQGQEGNIIFNFPQEILHIILNFLLSLYWPPPPAFGQRRYTNCIHCHIPDIQADTKKCRRHPKQAEVISSSECGDDCCYTVTTVRKYPCCGASYTFYSGSYTPDPSDPEPVGCQYLDHEFIR